MKRAAVLILPGILGCLFALHFSGCGSEEGTSGALLGEAVEEENLGAGVEEGETLCLSHMDCYDPVNETGNTDLDELGLVQGVPAPGSECPVPEPYGFDKGQRLDNTQLVDCEGNFFNVHDVICGSTVGWVYFYRGPS